MGKSLLVKIKEMKIMATNQGNSSSTRGGTSEQHAAAGHQRHKNDSGSGHSSHSGTQGGSSEQHAAAGRQSHKNDK